MKASLKRKVADTACRALQHSLPEELQSWGCAIRYEMHEISNDAEALLFVLGSLLGLAPKIFQYHAFRPFAVAKDSVVMVLGGNSEMEIFETLARRPRLIGVVCAIGAVALGLIYMALAGAPVGYMVMNCAALVIGLALLVVVGRAKPEDGVPSVILLLMSLGLLATALFGVEANDAPR